MTANLKIIVHAAEPATLVELLGRTQAGAMVESCDNYDGMNELVPDFGPDVVYSVRFAGTPGFPHAVLTGPAGPKWISVGGSGVDHLGRWNPDQITVTNAAGVAAEMMAQYIIGTLLNFMLDLDGLKQDQRAHLWRPRLLTPIAGKTLLIVGLGHTGRALARQAKAFGMHIIGTRARPATTRHVDEVHAASDVAGLWGRADFVVICAPLLATTRGLIDAKAFAAMKDQAIFIDVSRGGIVEQDALIEALSQGQIAAAALDVFENEPLPADNALWDFPNVLISPHCSSEFADWETASFQLFLANLERWINGDRLRNIVDPERGY